MYIIIYDCVVKFLRFLSVNSSELFFSPLAAGLWVCMNRVRVRVRVTVSTKLKIIRVN